MAQLIVASILAVGALSFTGPVASASNDGYCGHGTGGQALHAPWFQRNVFMNSHTYKGGHHHHYYKEQRLPRTSTWIVYNGNWAKYC